MTGGPPFTLANKYTFESGDISGTFDTTPMNGDPVASITLDGAELTDVSVAEHPLGWWLEATVKAAIDAGATVLSVVLPRINIDFDPETVDALAILATHRSSVGGTSFVLGALDIYEVRTLQATAWATQS